MQHGCEDSVCLGQFGLKNQYLLKMSKKKWFMEGNVVGAYFEATGTPSFLIMIISPHRTPAPRSSPKSFGHLSAFLGSKNIKVISEISYNSREIEGIVRDRIEAF